MFATTKYITVMLGVIRINTCKIYAMLVVFTRYSENRVKLGKMVPVVTGQSCLALIISNRLVLPLSRVQPCDAYAIFTVRTKSNRANAAATVAVIT